MAMVLELVVKMFEIIHLAVSDGKQRERAAALVLFANSLKLDFGNENDRRCRTLKQVLQQRLAEAKELGISCSICSYYKEKMKENDCSGYDKFNFENEGVLFEEDLDKLPERESMCQHYNSLAKRSILFARREGREKDCKHCDQFKEIVARYGCADLWKKEEGADLKEESA